MSRLFDFLKGLISLGLILSLLVGVPALLIMVAGWPFPTELPSISLIRQHISDGVVPDLFVIKVLAIVVWVVWVQLAAAVLIEAWALMRGRVSGRIPVLPGLQTFAGNLVASTVLLVSAFGPGRPTAAVPIVPITTVDGAVEAVAAVAGPSGLDRSLAVDPTGQGGGNDALGLSDSSLSSTSLSSTSSSSTASSTASSTDSGVAGADGHSSPGSTAGAVNRQPMPRAVGQYLTQSGDNWWDMAERLLDDGMRWSELRDMNAGKTMLTGEVISTTTEMVRAGWRLDVPADADRTLLETAVSVAQVEEPDSADASSPSDESAVSALSAVSTVQDRGPTGAFGQPEGFGESPSADEDRVAPSPWISPEILRPDTLVYEGPTEADHDGAGVAYQVREGDNLWDIAERHLGDPLRWPEIYEASTGLQQTFGRQISDPNLIWPDSILQLPPDAIAVPTADRELVEEVMGPEFAASASDQGSESPESAPTRLQPEDLQAALDAAGAVTGQPPQPDRPARPSDPSADSRDLGRHPDRLPAATSPPARPLPGPGSVPQGSVGSDAASADAPASNPSDRSEPGTKPAPVPQPDRDSEPGPVAEPVADTDPDPATESAPDRGLVSPAESAPDPDPISSTNPDPVEDPATAASEADASPPAAPQRPRPAPPVTGPANDGTTGPRGPAAGPVTPKTTDQPAPSATADAAPEADSRPGSTAPAAATFGAGGLLLATGLVGLLRRSRRLRLAEAGERSQPEPPPLRLAEIETVLRAGADSRSAASVWAVIESLADREVVAGEPVPAPEVIRFTRERIELVQSRPDPEVPAPWSALEDHGLSLPGQRSVSVLAAESVPISGDGKLPADPIAPLTVTAGRGLMINLESIGLTTIEGSPELVNGLVRSMVNELATGPARHCLDIRVSSWVAGADLHPQVQVSQPAQLVEQLQPWSEQVELGLAGANAVSAYGLRLSRRPGSMPPPMVVFADAADVEELRPLIGMAVQQSMPLAVVIAGPMPETGTRPTATVVLDGETARLEPYGFTAARQYVDEDLLLGTEALVAHARQAPMSARDDDHGAGNGLDLPSAGDQETDEAAVPTEETPERDVDTEQPEDSTEVTERSVDEDGGILIRVLGPLEIEGWSERLGEEETSLITFLSLVGPSTTEQIMDAVWPGRQVEPEHLDAVIERLRSTLQHRFVDIGDGRYRVRSVTTDLGSARQWISQAAAMSAQRSRNMLQLALSEVRGEPFASVPERWWQWTADHKMAIAAQASTMLMDACFDLCDDAYGAGDVHLARWACDVAALIDPLHETVAVRRVQLMQVLGQREEASAVVEQWEALFMATAERPAPRGPRAALGVTRAPGPVSDMAAPHVG